MNPTTLKGRYRVLRPLGRGGMSVVSLAEDTQSGRQVAVKRLALEGLTFEESRTLRAQFRREAALLRRLAHPGLVQVLDYFSEDCQSYLVTEFVEGRDLQVMLETSVERFDVETVLRWADQICEVLEYLHGHSVLFRDLKPANVILEKSGKVRLIDFGIARVYLPERETTALLRGFGTPGFAPIEQYAGGTDVRSDVYSLGATLYALMGGRPPADAALLASGCAPLTPLRKLNPEVPPALERVLEKMLAQRKTDRYDSVSAARSALRRSLARPVSESVSVQLCPHRDLGENVSGLDYLRPFTVIFEGEQVQAQQFLSSVLPVVPAEAFFANDFPGVVPGSWLVLVAHPHPGMPRPCPQRHSVSIEANARTAPGGM